MPEHTPSDPPFEEGHFRRVDESVDANFYQEPRLVTHIDDGAIGALRDHYAKFLPKNGRLLDLMSSWVSHYPDDLESERVAGLGMNADELAENLQLTEWVVHDLNADPVLPYGDDEFDVVTIAVSVQYLTQPIDVFREIGRVLQAGRRLHRLVLKPLLPDQGGPALAGHGRRGTRANGRRLFPLLGGI